MSTSIINVAAAVIVESGRILAARRRPGLHLEGFWEFPGGKIELGETPQQCLMRELCEEFGVSCRIGRYLGQSVYDYGEKRVCLVAYLVQIVDGALLPVDHDQILWLSPLDPPSLSWAPADVPLLAMAIDHLLSENSY